MNLSHIDIKHISFNLLNPIDIYNNATCEITTPISTQGNVLNTLTDPRLGVIDKGIKCAKCGLSYLECPGHFGYLRLAEPIIIHHNMNFIKNCLRSVCFHCSKVLIDKNIHKSEYNRIININKLKSRTSTLLEFIKGSKITQCPHCGEQVPTYNIDKKMHLTFVMLFGKTGKTGKTEKTGKTGKTEKTEDKSGEDKQQITLENTKIYDILSRISDEDKYLIGINKESRPEWLMATILSVPPPVMRPRVKFGIGNKSADDDLTHKLNDILKFNIYLANQNDEINKLKAADAGITDANKKKIEIAKMLQYHVTTYMNNDITGLAQSVHRSDKPIKSIAERIKGKESLIRGNIEGKRVGFTGRTVVGPFSKIKLNEIVIPVKIAKNLTFTEYVNLSNINTLTQLVRNGPNIYPGANEYVEYKTNYKKHLSSYTDAERRNIKLIPGDKVVRHLMNGDWVIFNRQPSLHKQSMMGHKVIVMPGKTFRMNTNATTPYNADFDGDEMNIHVIQSYSTVVEASLLASVQNQILSPQSSSPCMGFVQDSLLGVYLFSKYKGQLTDDEYMTLISQLKLIRPPPEMTSHGILSAIMPMITFSNNTIKIIDGIVHKDSIFNKSCSALIHIILNDYGPETGQKFIDDISIISHYWLKHKGFSTGYEDCIISSQLKVRNNMVIDKTLIEIDKLIKRVNYGYKIEYNTGDKITDETLSIIPEKDAIILEEKIITMLGKAKGEIINSIMKEHQDKNRDNALVTMTTAGSKGKPDNIGNISGPLSQQESVPGERVKDSLTKRSTVYSYKDSLDPNMRGWVRASYYEGLNLNEYIFHAIAGRNGVISKTIKTAETGYAQRRLIKASENVLVYYDLSIRDHDGSIIQYCHGNDGYDMRFLEKQPVSLLLLDDIKIVTTYVYDLTKHDDFLKLLKTHLTEDAYNNYINDNTSNVDNTIIKDHHDSIINISKKLRKNNKNIKTPIECAINFKRYLNTAISMSNNHHTTQRENFHNNLPRCDMSPIYIIKQINKLIENIKKNYKKSIVDTASLNTIGLVYSYINYIDIMVKYHISKVAFDDMISKIFVRIVKTLTIPGDMVGIVMAQSIGEPATQMTLNKFHHTGDGSKAKVSSGVPRFNELLSGTKQPKTPSLTAMIDENYTSKIYLRLLKEHDKEINDIKNKQKNKGTLDDDDDDVVLFMRSKMHEYLMNRFASHMIFMRIKDITKKIDVIYSGNNFANHVNDNINVKTDSKITNSSKKFNYCMKFSFDLFKYSIKRDHNNNFDAQIEQVEKIFDLSKIKNHHIDDYRIILNNDNKNSNEVVLSIYLLITKGNPIPILKAIEKSSMEYQIGGIIGINDVHIRMEKKSLPTIQTIPTIPNNENMNTNNINTNQTVMIDKLDPNYKDHRNKLALIQAVDNYIIDTDGSNLIAMANYRHIDKKTIISNNPNEMLQYYGITVAKKSIVRELQMVMEASGIELNIRHPQLLVDLMTKSGLIMSIDRFGINQSKGNNGPIHKATFEESVQQFVNAAFYAEKDNLTGVSGAVMFGQLFKGGTNSFQIEIDNEKFIKALKEKTLYKKTDITITNKVELDKVKIGKIKDKDKKYSEKYLKFIFKFPYI
jgi:DNA-directed RNA polymerase II subunit RPB1